ncbi:MAG: hypothetical protein ACK487_00095 [Sphingomonadales bacterium]|jgi:hypothetical protein
MINVIKYVKLNSVPLFKTAETDSLLASFDKRGFYFSSEAKEIYHTIKNLPHLYVAYGNKHYYIGKSFQTGGRWKRSHYYHLGTLAHEIHGTNKQNEHSHTLWIDSWMERKSVKFNIDQSSIRLKDEIKVSFIPFSIYTNQDYKILINSEIRAINKESESKLIEAYSHTDITLLNAQLNHKSTLI